MTSSRCCGCGQFSSFKGWTHVFESQSLLSKGDEDGGMVDFRSDHGLNRWPINRPMPMVVIYGQILMFNAAILLRKRPFFKTWESLLVLSCDFEVPVMLPFL